MSQRWLGNYLLALDDNHLFFLQSDIDEFTAKYGNSLGDLLHGDDESAAVEPAFEIFQRFLQRVRHNVALAQSLLHEKYDFNKNDTFTMPTDKSPWLKDQAASDALWRGYVKSDLLNGLLDKKDRLEVTIKRLSKRYDSLLRYWSEMEDLDVLEQYLCGLTHAYDPHSDYFQPEESENFSIQAIDHSVTGIGAELKSDDGYAVIEQIIAGGPADLDKRLKPGDKILAVGQGTKEPVDAVDMKLNHVVDMIRGDKGTLVHLVIQPAGAGDAVHKDIILKRDLVSIKDSLAKADIIEHQHARRRHRKDRRHPPARLLQQPEQRALRRDRLRRAHPAAEEGQGRGDHPRHALQRRRPARPGHRAHRALRQATSRSCRCAARMATRNRSAPKTRPCSTTGRSSSSSTR